MLVICALPGHFGWPALLGNQSSSALVTRLVFRSGEELVLVAGYRRLVLVAEAALLLLWRKRKFPRKTSRFGWVYIHVNLNINQRVACFRRALALFWQVRTKLIDWLLPLISAISRQWHFGHCLLSITQDRPRLLCLALKRLFLQCQLITF